MSEPSKPGLLHEVSRSVFWNTALLPLVTAAGLLLSILIRRSFGLESGLYDVVLGIANSILFYSGLGLAGTLPKFLPELRVRAGRRAAAHLVWRLGILRVGVVVAVLVALNIWAEPLARTLNLGIEGTRYLRWLSLLIVCRALLDFLYRALDSFLRQLRVNVLSLVNGLFDVVFAFIAVALGLHIAGVVGAIGVSAAVTAVLATFAVLKELRELPDRPGDSHADAPAPARIWKLAGLTYLRDLSLYFATPAFASPALLSVLGGPAPVALFATSYFVASSTVTLVVSGFRGIYRPVMARVLASGDSTQLQQAFDLINKLQILAVVPAGFGLAVMVGDYLPLLYGGPFEAAVPLARILVILLFAETALALPLVVLWADERYGPVLWAQGVMIAGAPLFVWTAGRYGLVAAAVVLGGSRLTSSVIGYLAAKRRYGVGYPWAFGAKVVQVSAIMAGVLAALRTWCNTSVFEASALTLLGIAIVLTGFRIFRVIGAVDLEILDRTQVPGRRWLVRWLSGA